MPPRYAAVDVEALSKTFRVPRQHIMTFKERALHPFRRVEVDELRALQDVSFQVLEGEFFGIVGRNGSGKSTLLKCLAGIYGADAGAIRIAGRLAPFIELGVGFNPDLAARDNVVLNGVMMGLTPREARARFDEIIAFAELEEFLDLKLKNYSSGMQVRLAFSVMVQSDADLLLIDEVLAVGDAAFQQKCFDVFFRLRDEGRTILFVTHDMHMVERFCHRALLLENGRIRDVGDPGQVGREYLALNFEHPEARLAGAPPAAEVSEAWIEAEDGRRVDAVAHGERVLASAVIEVREHVEDPQATIWLETDEGVRVFAASAAGDERVAEPLEPGERLRLRLAVENPLGDGRYYLGCALTGGSGHSEPVVHAARVADFVVFGAPEDAGLVTLEHSLELERELSGAPR